MLPEDPENIRILVGQATGFFESVIKSRQPDAPPRESDREQDYVRVVNRHAVRQHLAREQDRLSVEHCLRRDQFRCQVCEMSFREVYGEIGSGFAEAHHVLPLTQLAESVAPSSHDLVTVCANCHRMLHRLAGEEGDIARLRRMFHRE